MKIQKVMNELMDKKSEKKKLKTLYINSENLCNIKMPNVDSFLYGYSLKKIARSSSKKTPQNFNSTTKIMESSLTKSSSNGNHFVKVNQLINNVDDTIPICYQTIYYKIRVLETFNKIKYILPIILLSILIIICIILLIIWCYFGPSRNYQTLLNES